MGVRSKTDVMGWLRVGNRQRTVAATTWNEQSSRSHTVFTLFLTRRTVVSSSCELEQSSLLVVMMTLFPLRCVKIIPKYQKR